MGGRYGSASRYSVFAFAAQATVVLDLTTGGSSATGTGAIGGAFAVSQIDPQSTGTGVIDSFLRIQQTGSERGYNTSLYTNASNIPLDDVAGNFTRALTLGEIPIVTIGGQQYRQFLLDINQTSADPLLSLNQIQIFTASADMLHTSLSEATSSSEALIGFSGANEVFRMNNTTPLSSAYEIQLNYALNSGSGSGDMFLNVLNSAFAGLSASTNVILFSQFGAPPGQYSSNDGFEEWAVLKGASVVPEPASVVLLGTMLAGVGVWLRRRIDTQA